MSDVLQSLSCTQCGASPLSDNGDGTLSCPYCGCAFAHPERTCPHCQAINEQDARRCVSCGEVLRKPCSRCGALNWVQASHCSTCGASLDMLEHIALRRAETTAARLRRLQEEAPMIKEEAERASQARLERMWADDRTRLDALAKDKARQRTQEQIIWTIAALIIVALLIYIIASAVMSRYPVH